MKKLFGLIISLMVFIPTVVLAEEEAYEYFDFKVDMVEGSVIKDTNIKIFASVTSDDTNLTDRTDEFNVEEVMWSVCVDTDCAITEEVADDAVFEADKDYLFMIRITAINGADINVWGTDRAKFNGTPIENLDGEYGNTGKELMIKSKTAKETVVSDDIAVPKEEIEEPEVIAPAPTTGTTETCMFGFPFCCTMFLGLSLCVWIIIAVAVLLLIIIICIAKIGKNKPQVEQVTTPEEPIAPVEQPTTPVEASPVAPAPAPEPVVPAEPEQPTMPAEPTQPNDDNQLPPVA